MLFKNSELLAGLTLRKKRPYSKLFWSGFFPHFSVFGLNRGISPYSVQMRKIAGKMRTRITPNTERFDAVLLSYHCVNYARIQV